MRQKCFLRQLGFKLYIQDMTEFNNLLLEVNSLLMPQGGLKQVYHSISTKRSSGLLCVWIQV